MCDKPTITEFTASEIGFFEKDGMSIEYYAREARSTQNIILKFNVKRRNAPASIWTTTEDETKYLQKRMFKQFGQENLEMGKIDRKTVNDFIAKTYYEMSI